MPGVTRLGACFLPAGSSEERSNCRQSPQSRAWLAGVWEQWVCFLFNRLHLGARGRACRGASGTAGISGQPAGPPTRVGPPEGPAQDGPTTRPRVVAGSPPPVGPAAPLVALNHMPWTSFASPSPSLKSEPEEGRARGMGTAMPLRLGRAWLPRTRLLDGGVMGGGMDPVLLEQPSLGQAQGWMCLPL